MLMFYREVVGVAKKDAHIMVCMTSEFKVRLKARAQKEGRSVFNLAYKAIKDYLAKEEAHP